MPKAYRRRLRAFFRKLTSPVMSLQTKIVAIFLLLFTLTILIIIFVRSVNYLQALRYTSLEIVEYAANNVLDELHNVIHPLELTSAMTSKLIEKNVLNPKNILQMDNYLFNLTVSLPYVEGVFYGDDAGNMLFSEVDDHSIRMDFIDQSSNPSTITSTYRDLKGKFLRRTVSLNINRYDPRSRPWYLKAEQMKKTIWSNRFRSKLSKRGDYKFATATPVYQNNHLIGVFGLDVTLRYLNDFVEKQQVAKNGFSYVIAEDGDLIAFSKNKIYNLTNYQIREDGYYNLINVKYEKIPIIYESLKLFNTTDQKKFLINYQNNKYLVYYDHVKELGNSHWLVGVIVPQSDFVGALRTQNIVTLAISFIAMLVGIFMVSTLISRALRPIQLLVRETEKIKNFELDDFVTTNSKIKEIAQLNEGLNSMKIGLKHFQKYVPGGLVKQLIASGEDVRIGGIKKNLVIFFSDIQNFTTISEKVDPTALTVQLCEYFENLSQIILSEKGTIDKYIGDSIMVFWGAPIREAHPCTHAAKTALACQAKLEELNEKWNHEGKPSLITRIGIHYGEAIVGNMGSSERVNYTAIGDTINTASRLEQINKVYGSRITVSEPVYQILKNKYLFRMLDYIAVKGRTEKIYIYELLGHLDKTLKFDLAKYKEEFAKGFQAYLLKQWHQALAHFEKCMAIYPDDTLAPIFIYKIQLQI